MTVKLFYLGYSMEKEVDLDGFRKIMKIFETVPIFPKHQKYLTKIDKYLETTFHVLKGVNFQGDNYIISR